MKYNKQCPGHDHICWAHRQLMREDDIICTPDYKRLPQALKNLCWQIKDGKNIKSNLSIVVDWLLEHQTDNDINCAERAADIRLKEENLKITDSWSED